MWKSVRAWSRRRLEHLKERVMDVHGDEEEDEPEQAADAAGLKTE